MWCKFGHVTSRHSAASPVNVPTLRSTQGPSWVYSKVDFDRFFRKFGRLSPNVNKNGATAARTGLGYPHEGRFVKSSRSRSPGCSAVYRGSLPSDQATTLLISYLLTSILGVI